MTKSSWRARLEGCRAAAASTGRQPVAFGGMTVLSDVLVIGPAVLGSAVVGSVITEVGQAAAGRRADRKADRGQARALFTQIVTATAVIDVEKTMFRERRDSWRPNALALGQVLLQLGAAWKDGNWLRGAAAGLGEIRQWDADEGARFIDRLQAAATQANPALVSLSLLSPGFEAPCTRVSDALGRATAARRRADREKARDDLLRTITELRGAVYEFTAPRDHFRLRRPRGSGRPARGSLGAPPT